MLAEVGHRVKVEIERLTVEQAVAAELRVPDTIEDSGDHEDRTDGGERTECHDAGGAADSRAGIEARIPGAGWIAGRGV